MLCRAWRAVSNCLQSPHSCLALLHMQGLATLLGKAFTRQEGDAVAQVLVRCARLAGETGQQKALLLQEGVLAGLAELALLHSESGDTV